MDFRQVLPTSALALASVLTASCGGSPSTPTTPGGSATAGAVVAVLKIKSSATPALSALGAALEFDASESRGQSLRYRIEFGDGDEAAVPTATHVGRVAGSHTAILTVTDGNGATSRAELPYFVAVLRPSEKAVWRATNGGDEQILQLDQSSDHVSGLYYQGGEHPRRRALGGSLSADRRLLLQTDDGQISIDASLEWAAGSKGCLQQSCVVIRTALAVGSTAVSEFAPVDAALVAPATQVDLTSDIAPSFGVSSYPPSQVVDLSHSRGVGLSYQVDYGDGVRSDARTSSYSGSNEGFRTGAATVTDLFGGSSSQSFHYFMFNPYGPPGWDWWQTRRPDARTPYIVLPMWQVDANGNLTGYYREGGGAEHSFLGRLTGQRSFEMETNDGSVSMRGAFEWAGGPFGDACKAGTISGWDWVGCIELRVTIRGGVFNGQTMVLFKTGQ